MADETIRDATKGPGEGAPAPHRWRFIEDLPSGHAALADPETEALLRVWMEQKERLKATDALRRFNEQYVRSWCIETGILERLYTLDRGVTRTLVEQGFDAALVPHGSSDLPAERLIPILEDHREVAEGLSEFVESRRPLSLSYVKQLHQVLTRHQEDCEAIDTLGRRVRVPLMRGDWKRLPNNPGDPATGRIVHEYCPPEHVAAEMDRLVAMHLAHGEVRPEVEAAWLHHRFTQIHPFQDGNGRIARALASLVLLRAGGFPLLVDREDRAPYIEALQAADGGDLAALVRRFVRAQKSAFLMALSLSQEVVEEVTELHAVAKDAAERMRGALLEKEKALRRLASTLAGIAQGRMESAAKVLEAEIRKTVPSFDARVYASTPETEHSFGAQIAQVASSFGYTANLSSFRCWRHLRLRHTFTASLVVAFHHVGRPDGGVMIATAFLWIREERAKADDPTASAQPLSAERICEEAFALAAGRDPAEAKSAFERWFDRSLKVGLAAWRKKL